MIFSLPLTSSTGFPAGAQIEIQNLTITTAALSAAYGGMTAWCEWRIVDLSGGPLTNFAPTYLNPAIYPEWDATALGFVTLLLEQVAVIYAPSS